MVHFVGRKELDGYKCGKVFLPGQQEFSWHIYNHEDSVLGSEFRREKVSERRTKRHFIGTE